MVQDLIASKTRLVDGKRGRMAPIVLGEAEEADEADVGDVRKMCERRMVCCFILALVCADVHTNLLMIMS